MLAPRRQLPARQQLLEGNAATRYPALDRTHRAAADFRGFFISKTAGTNEDQSLALRLRQMHERPLHVAKFDVPVLACRRSEDLRSSDVVPLALEAGAAHLAEEQVAKDNESPRPHVRPGLKPLSRRPGFEKRFLDKIISKVAAARQGSAERTKVGNHRRELFLELRIG